MGVSKRSFFERETLFKVIILFIVSLSLLSSFFETLAPVIYKPDILGVADTAHTWEFDSTSAGDYTYDNSLITIDNSGARPATSANKFSNPGFEANITSWNTLATPDGIPSLHMWLKADAIEGFTDGQGMHQWLDSGPNNINGSQADPVRYPLYVANGVNGLPAVRFNTAAQGSSTSGYFSLNSLASNQPGSNITLMLAISPSVMNGVFDSAPLLSGQFRNFSTNTWSGGGFTSVTLGITTSDPVLITISTTKSGSNKVIKYYRNGQLVSDLANVNSSEIPWVGSSGKPPQIGSGNDGTVIYRGLISEAILFNTTLTENEINNLNYYIAQKYNLTTFATPVYTAQYNNTNTYNGTAGSLEVSSVDTPLMVKQSLNLGDSDQYAFSSYVKKPDNSEVTATDLQLMVGGEAISTVYTNAGSGWWKLSAPVNGTSSSRDYGLYISANKNLYIDEITLKKVAEYSAYSTLAYSNQQIVFWETMTSTENASNISSIRYQLCDNDGAICESNDTWQYWNGSAWNTATNSTTHTNVIADLNSTAMNAFSIANTKISLKVIMDFEGIGLPTVNDVSVGLITDSTPPETNATNIEMEVTNGGREILNGEWANSPAPFFRWTAGTDNDGGSGIKGYCLYLGQGETVDPEDSKGILGASPVSTAGTPCGFIIADPEIDFATLAYRGAPWLGTDSQPYYLNIKAVDNAGTIYAGDSESFSFLYDETVPQNVAYINPASGTFNSIADMNFSWPVNGAAASSDIGAGLLGWQYAINSTVDWLGTETDSSLGVDYIPIGYTQPHHLSEIIDGTYIILGDNVIYFRTIDIAGNISTTATYRTGSLAYGGNAPLFPGDAVVTVSPSSSISNSFALSWPSATPANDRTISSYYYMINTNAPATLATLTGNSATYIPTTNLSVPAGMLNGAQRGSNEVRVVAVDDAGNYSPSNSIVGTFTLNSNNPDPAQDLTASDASIKAASLWRAALAWSPPDYTGTGVLTYIIQRSDNGTSWTQIATTTGNAYVDTVAESRQYYWRVGTIDTSDASINSPSFTNAVTLTPRGAFTSPATLTSDPVVSGLTTRQVTINWTTNRTSDSKIAFGTVSGEYNPEEISNSAQVTNHNINITNLLPGTTYYYVAKWTDEDGNTGSSTEKTFTTLPAPSVGSVKVTGINLTSATITYTVQGATAVKIYYGPTNAFGGLSETLTSSGTATYSTTLTGLQDGQTYYFKINPVDNENIEYQGTVLDFTTLPRPRVSNIKVEQILNTAQPTIKVTWDSNTEVSSIVSYYPEGKPELSLDVVDLILRSGRHRARITGLLPLTTYELVVKGQDVNGNQAQSDIYRFTTASDTRPPLIYDLRIEGGTSTSNTESEVQLIVSWKTDEPATSQVEFGEGTGSEYLQKTQKEENLKTNHLVIISGLSPSKVYHLRALSEDSAQNTGFSNDNSVITPKAPDNALSLVIRNLLEIFGFLN